MIIILVIVLILLVNGFNFCWWHGSLKIWKTFVLLYWGNILVNLFSCFGIKYLIWHQTCSCSVIQNAAFMMPMLCHNYQRILNYQPHFDEILWISISSATWTEVGSPARRSRPHHSQQYIHAVLSGHESFAGLPGGCEPCYRCSAPMPRLCQTSPSVDWRNPWWNPRRFPPAHCKNYPRRIYFNEQQNNSFEAE